MQLITRIAHFGILALAFSISQFQHLAISISQEPSICQLARTFNLDSGSPEKISVSFWDLLSKNFIEVSITNRKSTKYSYRIDAHRIPFNSRRMRAKMCYNKLSTASLVLVDCFDYCLLSLCVYREGSY